MAKGVIVDFTGVESGGGRTRVPEDDYRVKVTKVEQKESKLGNQMLVWTFEISEGKHKGKTLVDYSVLTNEALWKLKQILEAMGISVPNKRVALDTRNYIGRELGITTVDDEYEGRVSSKVGDYLSIDILEGTDVDELDEDEEEEEPAPKKAKKGKKKKQQVEEEEDLDELDLDSI